MICEERKPLTDRQQEIYDYICRRIASGLPPTVREIGEEFAIRSPNGVMCHIKALEKKGWIVRGRSLSRWIRLGPESPDFLRATLLEDALRQLVRAISRVGGRIRTRPEFRDAMVALEQPAEMP